MKDIFDKIQAVLADMWNYLYRFLAHLFGEDINDDWIVDSMLNG